MTLVAPLSKSPRFANPDHPRFLGLALLRSLLQNEDVAADSRRTDAVLDLIGLLLRDAPAGSVVRAFCRVRRLCAPVCYMPIFRLRRWLEERIVVQAAGAAVWQPLTLAFQDYRRIEQDYRRQAWESDGSSQDWDTAVSFAWTCGEPVEAPPLAVEA